MQKQIPFLFLISIFFLLNCQNNSTLFSVDDLERALDNDVGPVNIQGFRAFSNENQINIHWVTDQPIHPGPDPAAQVDIVRLYMSEEGPDAHFVLIHESAHNRDSTSVYNLEGDVVYYFRIAALTKSETLIGVSHPVMVTLGLEQDLYYTLPVNRIDSPFEYCTIDWSADGQSLVYLDSNDDFHANLYLLDCSSFNIRQLTEFSSDDYRLTSFACSPDGNNIAFSYSPSLMYEEIDYRIWILNIQNLLKESCSSGRLDSDPSWITNQRLLFCKRTLESTDAPEFYTTDLSSTNEKRITDNQLVYKYSPALSPSKEWIAYSGHAESRRNIFIIDTTGTNNKSLTASEYWDDLYPCWSADGQKIYFTSNRSGNFEIWSFELNDQTYRQISHGLQKRSRFFGKIDPQQRYMAVIESHTGPDQLLQLYYYDN